MKHLKTFESFADAMKMTACPVCHSENVKPLGGNNYDCIDCGNEFFEEFEEPYQEDEEETENADAKITEEEEEDFMDTPELSADELDQYSEDDAKINTILVNASEMDQVLADQLKFEAEGSDSYADFLKRAEATIQDIKGVEREEAMAILNSLM